MLFYNNLIYITSIVIRFQPLELTQTLVQPSGFCNP